MFSVAGGSGSVEKIAPPQILLLYARDCEPFMNMMTTFRQVLKEVIACEVRVNVIYIEV